MLDYFLTQKGDYYDLDEVLLRGNLQDISFDLTKII